MAQRIDPMQMRAALEAVGDWIDGGEKPARVEVARAVRLSVRTLAQEAPGHAVEVRVPPFVAVQCIEGPAHTRGTPPSVVETDPLIWLKLATGRLDFAEAVSSGAVEASGTRAGEVTKYLPVLIHFHPRPAAD